MPAGSEILEPDTRPRTASSCGQSHGEIRFCQGRQAVVSGHQRRKKTTRGSPGQPFVQESTIAARKKRGKVGASNGDKRLKTLPRLSRCFSPGNCKGESAENDSETEPQLLKCGSAYQRTASQGSSETDRCTGVHGSSRWDVCACPDQCPSEAQGGFPGKGGFSFVVIRHQ